MTRNICDIAHEIREKWPKMSPYAAPYVDAMEALVTVNDNYYADSGRSIILYFLANAAGWRGEDARRIKKELNDALKRG